MLIRINCKQYLHKEKQKKLGIWKKAEYFCDIENKYFFSKIVRLLRDPNVCLKDCYVKAKCELIDPLVYAFIWQKTKDH